MIIILLEGVGMVEEWSIYFWNFCLWKFIIELKIFLVVGILKYNNVFFCGVMLL